MQNKQLFLLSLVCIMLLGQQVQPKYYIIQRVLNFKKLQDVFKPTHVNIQTRLQTLETSDPKNFKPQPPSKTEVKHAAEVCVHTVFFLYIFINLIV